MRPGRFPPPPRPQAQAGGIGRGSGNQHRIINYLLQQQQLMQHQQRQLLQQNSGLNAAIRELQQRSLHQGLTPSVAPAVVRLPHPAVVQPALQRTASPIPVVAQNVGLRLPVVDGEARELMTGEWRPIENTYRPKAYFESGTQSKDRKDHNEKGKKSHYSQRDKSEERSRSREDKRGYDDDRDQKFDKRGRDRSVDKKKSGKRGDDRHKSHSQDGQYCSRESSREKREHKRHNEKERGKVGRDGDAGSFSRSKSDKGSSRRVDGEKKNRLDNKDCYRDRSQGSDRSNNSFQAYGEEKRYDKGRHSKDNNYQNYDRSTFDDREIDAFNSHAFTHGRGESSRGYNSADRSRLCVDDCDNYSTSRDSSRKKYDRSPNRPRDWRETNPKRPFDSRNGDQNFLDKRNNERSNYEDHYGRKRKWQDDVDRRDDFLSKNEEDNFDASKSKRRHENDAKNDSHAGLSQYRKDLLEQQKMQDLPDDNFPDDLNSESLGMISDDELNSEDELKLEEEEKFDYVVRSCPADLFFNKNSETGNKESTQKMKDLEAKFEEKVVKRAENLRSTLPESMVTPPAPPTKPHVHSYKCRHGATNGDASSCDSSSSSEGEISDDEDDDENPQNPMMEEWERKRKHPLCLHKELWYNEPGRVNDGPLCRCSLKSRKSGIRHDIYPGEDTIPKCDPCSNNLDKLYHYRITMTPYVNFLSKTPTLIKHDDHEYIFEGFSIFTHTPLENIPPCKLLRFNIAYTILLIPENPPENFSVSSLDMFSDFIFTEVLEMLDLDWGGKDGGCRRFHFLPRFCRNLPDSGCKELLSMNQVLSYLLKSSKPLISKNKLLDMKNISDEKWRTWLSTVRGMIVTKPSMKPSSIRIDQVDRNNVMNSKSTAPSNNSPPTNSPKSDFKVSLSEKSPNKDGEVFPYPLIIHQSYRPAQLSYAGDPTYRRAWRSYIKFRQLVNSKPSVNPNDRQKLKAMEENLQNICVKKTMKREVTVEVSSEDFLSTGIRADLCQHALMVPVLVSHLRFHISLRVLEDLIGYKFKDRNLLQLSLTHSSYRTNFGINPDHTRNSLTNCGMRQLQYGDRSIHHQHTRKRGISILLDIMARYGKQEESVSEVPHNERLEFLGDAVIEFLSSVHLFYLFPWLQEGALSTYRMALVQNQHLPILARKLRLQDFMLYIHGPDLCMQSDFKHAMANCFEALMGALYLDADMEVVDEIYGRTLFDDDPILLETWKDMPQHVLQQAEPGGDRHWIKSVPVLKKLEKFEESIGVKFTHIRLLAKAFTHRNIKHNPITLGHNQRLEYLGDTVLKLLTSEYLYRFYPEHHEGHLSLLRSSLVNNRTQAIVYDDLAMGEYFIYEKDAMVEMKTKQRADVLEAFVGALFVDKGLIYCWSFCNVCFFPRLKDFISNQSWNDPKSQLQQVCLTLREVGGGEPDIPVYKMIESIGPTNTRLYKVAVYFRGKRLATGQGHTIQLAEMDAAAKAMSHQSDLLPILQHQRRYLDRYQWALCGKEEEKEKNNTILAQFAKDRRGKTKHPEREKRKERRSHNRNKEKNTNKATNKEKL